MLMTCLPVIFLFGRHSFERPPSGSDFYALPLPWGGRASEGLRFPSLKSDVHSTCWFFKQLYPLKNKKKRKKKKVKAAHSQFAEELGAGKGGGGLWSSCYQTLFLCLSLSLTPSLLISVVTHFQKLFYSFIIQPDTTISLTLHDMW